MDLTPLEKGKREAEDAIETEAASAKKQKVEETVCEIKTHTIEIENKVETSFEADEQLIKVISGVNGNVVNVLEDKSNVLEEDMGVAEKKLVVVLKEEHVATAFENADDSNSCLQDESRLDENASVAIKASATLMEEDPSTSLKKKDECSKGPNSFTDDAAFSTEDVTAANLSSPAPGTEISLVSIQKKDDSSTHELDSSHETYKGDIVDTATEKVPVVLPETIDESCCDDERSNRVTAESTTSVVTKQEDEANEELELDDGRSNKVTAESIASVVTKQEDETNEELELDDETSGSDGDDDDDLQTPTTPTERTNGGKTLFVANLSFSIEREDVEDFFKAAGEVVNIRFAMNSDETFKGYGYVEFASAEAAEKALRELNGKELLRRRVRLDLVRQRGSFTPYTGQGTASLQNGATAQGQTVFVRGFNNTHCQDEIRKSLEEHFGSCGEISRISVPKDQDGCVRGFAYIHFKDSGAFSRALALNGSEFKEGTLSVKEARPTCDSRDSASSGRGYDRNGGRYNWQGFGGRSGGPNFQGRIGWSGFRGRSTWSDSQGRSGGSDFQGRGYGSNFRGRSGESELGRRHVWSDSQERSGGSDFQGRGYGSNFRERSGELELSGRHGGSDIWGRGGRSDFRGRSGGSDFSGRLAGSDFRGRGFGSDFQRRGRGSGFHDNWSNIHGSGGSDFRGRSGGSEFRGRSDWFDFRGRSGSSDFHGRTGRSNFCESGGSNFRGRSSWSNIHGRGGQPDFGGRSVHETGIRFGAGVWKHSSGRGNMGSNVGGTGNGDWFGGGGGGGGGQGTLIEPTIAAPASVPGNNTAVIGEEGKLKDEIN